MTTKLDRCYRLGKRKSAKVGGNPVKVFRLAAEALRRFSASSNYFA